MSVALECRLTFIVIYILSIPRDSLYFNSLASSCVMAESCNNMNSKLWAIFVSDHTWHHLVASRLPLIMFNGMNSNRCWTTVWIVLAYDVYVEMAFGLDKNSSFFYKTNHTFQCGLCVIIFDVIAFGMSYFAGIEFVFIRKTRFEATSKLIHVIRSCWNVCIPHYSASSACFALPIIAILKINKLHISISCAFQLNII